MRITRTLVAACAVICVMGFTNTDVKPVPHVCSITTPDQCVAIVAPDDHPETKRSIAVYYAEHYRGADQPFIARDPVAIPADAVSQWVAALKAPDMVVEVCHLVPRADGEYGPPPYHFADRVAAECRVWGTPQ